MSEEGITMHEVKLKEAKVRKSKRQGNPEILQITVGVVTPTHTLVLVLTFLGEMVYV